MKRLHTEWEKIFENHISDKWLIVTYIKNMYNSIAHTHKNLTKKWAEDLKRHFSKEDIQKVNRYMTKMFNITNHQGNANQNHNVKSPHIC